MAIEQVPLRRYAVVFFDKSGSVAKHEVKEAPSITKLIALVSAQEAASHGWVGREIEAPAHRRPEMAVSGGKPAAGVVKLETPGADVFLAADALKAKLDADIQDVQVSTSDYSTGEEKFVINHNDTRISAKASDDGRHLLVTVVAEDYQERVVAAPFMPARG